MASLTVVIPTQNRASTLRGTLTNVLEQDGTFLVHVLDNCSTDETLSLRDEVSDGRVRWFRSEVPLSMARNFSRGIDTVETEWLTVLGSDDGFVSGALARAEKILGKCETYAIRAGRHHYYWPDSTPTGVGELHLSFSRRAFLGHSGLTRVNATAALQAVLDGDASYDFLPLLYTGSWVRTEAALGLPRIRGGLFPTNIPDVYSGFALAMRFGDYDHLHESMFINGASAGSNGRAWDGTHDPERDTAIMAAFHISREKEYQFVPEGMKPPRSTQYFVFSSYLDSVAAGLASDATTTLDRQLDLVMERDGWRPENAAWVARVRATSQRAEGTKLPRHIPGNSGDLTSFAPVLLRSGLDRLRDWVSPLFSLMLRDSESYPLQNVSMAARAAHSLRWPHRRLLFALRRSWKASTLPPA